MTHLGSPRDHGCPDGGGGVADKAAVRLADDGAAIPVLQRRLEVEPAALEQDDAMSKVGFSPVVQQGGSMAPADEGATGLFGEFEQDFVPCT